MENQVRLIKAWIDSLSERQRAVLVTSLILTIAQAENIPFEEVIGSIAPTLEEVK